MHRCFATTSQSPGSLLLQITPIQFLDICFWKGRVLSMCRYILCASDLMLLGVSGSCIS